MSWPARSVAKRAWEVVGTTPGPVRVAAKATWPWPLVMNFTRLIWAAKSPKKVSGPAGVGSPSRAIILILPGRPEKSAEVARGIGAGEARREGDGAVGGEQGVYKEGRRDAGARDGVAGVGDGDEFAGAADEEIGVGRRGAGFRRRRRHRRRR